MNEEIKDMLLSANEHTEKLIKERQEAARKKQEDEENKNKEKLCRNAIKNSKIINKILLEELLDITFRNINFDDQKGYFFQISFIDLVKDNYEKLLKNESVYESKEYTQYASSKGLLKDGEEIAIYFDNQTEEEVLFVFDSKLYSLLGITRYEDRRKDFIIDLGVAKEQAEKIISGEIKLRKRNAKKYIIEKYTYYKEKNRIKNAFHRLSKINANLVYTNMYKKILDQYMNSGPCDNDFYVVYFKYFEGTKKNVNAYCPNTFCNDFIDYNLVESLDIIIVEYINDNNEVSYLPMFLDDLEELINDDHLLTITCDSKCWKASVRQADIEKATMNAKNEYTLVQK